MFVFMVLFLSNAYNFSDGLDTLSGGLGMILAFGFVAIWYLKEVQAFVPDTFFFRIVLDQSPLLIAMSLGAAFIPFLVLNAPPAKVFMGDVGALPIGALFGWITMFFIYPFDESGGVIGFNTDMIAPMLVFLGIMFIEIVPVPLQIASVKLRKQRLFPFKDSGASRFAGCGVVGVEDYVSVSCHTNCPRAYCDRYDVARFEVADPVNRAWFDGKRIAVAGMGVSGLAVGRAVNKLGGKAVVFDQQPGDVPRVMEAVDRLQTEGIEAVTGWHGRLDPAEFDLLVVSPGLPRQHPVMHDMAGKVIGEVEFAFAVAEAPMLAITGTNGKSTTTVMLWLILQGRGGGSSSVRKHRGDGVSGAGVDGCGDGDFKGRFFGGGDQ